MFQVMDVGKRHCTKQERNTRSFLQHRVQFFNPGIILLLYPQTIQDSLRPENQVVVTNSLRQGQSQKLFKFLIIAAGDEFFSVRICIGLNDQDLCVLPGCIISGV